MQPAVGGGRTSWIRMALGIGIAVAVLLFTSVGACWVTRTRG
ncbi:hypothetical protein AB0F91_10830 [Amycolatopsis sp. NPDC023774]